MKRCYVCGKRIWFRPLRVVVKYPDKKVTIPAYPDADAGPVQVPIKLLDTEIFWIHEGCIEKLIVPTEEEHEGNT